MRVFIYACEQMYGGLHGIEDKRVVEVDSFEEANEYGEEMSRDVIESYDTLGDFDEYEDEEAYEEAFLENREWHIYPINEEVCKDFSTEVLDKVAYDLGYELFVKEYCGKEIYE